MLSLSLSTDNKEYDAYLSYTKVDLDSLGRSGFLDVFENTTCCIVSSKPGHVKNQKRNK